MVAIYLRLPGVILGSDRTKHRQCPAAQLYCLWCVAFILCIVPAVTDACLRSSCSSSCMSFIGSAVAAQCISPFTRGLLLSVPRIWACTTTLRPTQTLFLRVAMTTGKLRLILAVQYFSGRFTRNDGPSWKMRRKSLRRFSSPHSLNFCSRQRSPQLHSCWH
jgi:hypothetical protein